MTALEVLFLHLDIYRHHGWQLLYTIVLFLAYTLVAIALIAAFERHGYSTWHRVACAFTVWLFWLKSMGWWHARPFWYPSYGGIMVVLTHLALSLLDRRTARLAGASNKPRGA